MDALFLVILIVLLGLAVLGLVVGVTNDAVNFLNSSLGSKVAPMWVILTVASFGVLIGALFSSGMMEVARSGVFYPEKFTFPSIMILFLVVMLTNVILLDLFNTFGLPTSTTVSLVFELLGSAVAVSLYTMWTTGNEESIGAFINSGKALAIISGIFISIAIAFVVGNVIMYLSRLIFSFNYKKPFRYLGALWSGVALTAITYFAVFKGLKGSVLVTDELLAYLESNMVMVLLYTFLGWTVLMAICQFLFRINILKIIVLVGTAALAMAFAGNDLVNFIGVFMAGLDSFQIAREAASLGIDIHSLHMVKLAEPIPAHFGWLLGSGLIMIAVLWFSKKTKTVSDTEVNLARKGEGIERFSSSPLSRSIVRSSLNFSKSIEKITPAPVKRFIEKQFEPVELENNASFDLIRASVNLTVSALLISLGTSLKLPLSTTYVSFMVAMGSSLADRAWGRESAVYRINGVLTVIAGWLMTALLAFAASMIVGLFLMWGKIIAIIIMLALVAYSMIQSNKLHSERKNKETQHRQILSDETQLIDSCNKEVHLVMDQTLSVFQGIITGLKDENRKAAKKAMKTANEMYEKFKDKRDYEIVPTLEKIQISAMDLEQEYVQLVGYSYEITKSLKAISEATYKYIDNNHAAFSNDQIDDLTTIRKTLSDVYAEYYKIEKTGDFSQPNQMANMRNSVIELNAKMTKRQIKRVKQGDSTTRSSILFLNLVNEIKIITLQSSNLMKSHRAFLKQYEEMK